MGQMRYNKEAYIGKKIQLYPGDTYAKWGEILDVDDLGWTIKITDVKVWRGDHYDIGDIVFISHTTPFSFKFGTKKKEVFGYEV